MKLSQRLGCGAAILSLVVFTGCQRSASEKPVAKAPQTKSPERQVMTEEEAAVLTPFAAPTKLSEGDKAWQAVIASFKPPTIPEQWQTNEPSKEEIKRFQLDSAKVAVEAADKAKDFFTRFPEHEKAEEARQAEMALLNQAARLGDTNRLGRLRELEEAQLKNPDLPEDQRLELRLGQLQRRVANAEDNGMAAALTELDKGVRALQKEFPNRAELSHLLVSAAQGWLDHGEVEKSRALAQEIVKTQSDEEIKAAAEELLKKVERVGKPLSIKFTALDGREVDLEKMKGKVVLVDFWATWCRPCLGELPKVKAAYDKYHAQGFEIIGLSMDDDKEALETMLASQKMTWPQYFDAEDSGKKWGREFGVSAIPAMWLVDKKGLLRELNAREDLAGKVAKLLAEK